MKCILCDKIETSHIINEYDKWKLYKCDHCDLMCWHPMTFLKDQYKDDLSYMQHALGEILKPYHFNALNSLKRRFSGSKNKIKILEIGCGNGSFLKLVRDRLNLDIDCYGIDLNPGAIEYARTIAGENVFYMDFFEDNPKFEIESFDIICFFEVLEHQTDLKRFMQKTTGLLRPGGFLMGSVPNREKYRPLGKRGTDDYPPHHFLWWNEKALSYIMETFCLDNREIEACNSWSISGISLFIETVFFAKFKGFLKRQSIQKQEGSPGNKVVYRKSFTLKLLNNKLARFIRSVIFMPLSIPIFFDSYRSKRNHKTLLFSGSKRIER